MKITIEYSVRPAFDMPLIDVKHEHEFEDDHPIYRAAPNNAPNDSVVNGLRKLVELYEKKLDSMR